MLKCRDLAEQASDFVDDNLKPAERWRVRLHIFMCAHCRRFIRHLRVTKSTSAALDFESPSPDEVDGIIQHTHGKLAEKGDE